MIVLNKYKKDIDIVLGSYIKDLSKMRRNLDSYISSPITDFDFVKLFLLSGIHYIAYGTDEELKCRIAPLLVDYNKMFTNDLDTNTVCGEA